MLNCDVLLDLQPILVRAMECAKLVVVCSGRENVKTINFAEFQYSVRYLHDYLGFVIVFAKHGISREESEEKLLSRMQLEQALGLFLSCFSLYRSVCVCVSMSLTRTHVHTLSFAPKTSFGFY